MTIYTVSWTIPVLSSTSPQANTPPAVSQQLGWYQTLTMDFVTKVSATAYQASLDAAALLLGIGKISSAVVTRTISQ